MPDPTSPEPLAYTVVIPAYNEAEGIASVLRLARETAKGAEIIVVDDGSTDGTAEAARQAGGGGVRVIQHAENLGYGAALKTGIRAATHDLIAIADADGTYPVERIPELVERARQADMIVGARTDPQSVSSWQRRLGRWALSRLANYLARRRIPDFNSGLRVMRRSALEPYWGILPNGFSFTTTVTLAMHADGRRVEYVPIACRPRHGRSKIRPIREPGNFVQLILRTILYFAPLRVFGPASILLFAASLAVLVYGILWHNILDGTIVALFVAGLQLMGIGLVADLINRRLGR